MSVATTTRPYSNFVFIVVHPKLAYQRYLKNVLPETFLNQYPLEFNQYLYGSICVPVAQSHLDCFSWVTNCFRQFAAGCELLDGQAALCLFPPDPSALSFDVECVCCFHAMWSITQKKLLQDFFVVIKQKLE
jgi:hypothetical protein